MEANTTKSPKQAAQSAGQAIETVATKAKNAAQSIDKKIENADTNLTEPTMATRFEDLRGRAEEGLEASYDVVKQYPLYSILGAAAFGFLAGGMLKRIGR